MRLCMWWTILKIYASKLQERTNRMWWRSCVEWRSFRDAHWAWRSTLMVFLSRIFLWYLKMLMVMMLLMLITSTPKLLFDNGSCRVNRKIISSKPQFRQTCPLFAFISPYKFVIVLAATTHLFVGSIQMLRMIEFSLIFFFVGDIFLFWSFTWWKIMTVLESMKLMESRFMEIALISELKFLPFEVGVKWTRTHHNFILCQFGYRMPFCSSY